MCKSAIILKKNCRGAFSALLLDTRHSALGTRHSALDTRHSTLDTRHSTLGTRDPFQKEHCSYYSGKKPKTVRSYFRNQLYRSLGLRAHRGWARLLLDRRCLVGTSNAPRGCSNRSNYRSAHDEETAYDSYYMNPVPGFRAGPGDSYDAA